MEKKMFKMGRREYYLRMRIDSRIQQLLEREVLISLQSEVIIWLILLHFAIRFDMLPSLVFYYV